MVAYKQIKKIVFICMAAFVLLASDCRKQKDKCHYEIQIQNKSNTKVIWAIVAQGIYGCQLDGAELLPGGIAKYDPFSDCLEVKLANGLKEQIFIVDLDSFNPANLFYDCDSVVYKNKILQHFSVSLEDLQNNNFTITYP